MTELPKTADVAIVGGGVIGLAIARALALRGVGEVVVIDRGSLGNEASSAAAGMIGPQVEADSDDSFFKLSCQSRDLYPEFAESLRAETGLDVELDRTGTLYLAFNEQDQSEIEHRYSWQTKAGLTVEKLGVREARTLEPSISEQIRGALRFPKDIQVENRRLVRALVAANERLGVSLVTDATVDWIRTGSGRVGGVTTSRGSVSSPTVVLASGAWTSSIRSRDEALPNLNIEPARGQMICLDSDPKLARHVIFSPRGYIVPRLNGRVLAGSTTEFGVYDKCVTAAGLHSILTHALEISPRIAKLAIVDSWAGLRPRAPDGLPVLGPCAGIRGLVYATGHYRNGILLAPITAELTATLITDGLVSPLLDAFAPNRFELIGVN